MKLSAALLLSASLAAAEKPRTLRERLAGPVVGAHQGELYGAKNSLRGFENARAGGADIIEMDLRLSKDGIPVVYHDSWMGFWTDCWGFVEKMSFAEIQKCRYRFHGDSIPSFEQVLDWSNGKVLLDAEFKVDEVIAPAIELARKKNAYEWVYFQTQWDPAKYYKARALDATVALQFQPWTLERMEWALARRDARLLIIELNELTRTPEIIRAIRNSGKLSSLNSWSGTILAELRGAHCGWVFRQGVDIAITNRPADCARQRGPRQNERLAGPDKPEYP